MGGQVRGPEPSDRRIADAAWSSLSYLLGGIVVWGGAGWLVDHWLGTYPVLTVVGMLVGISGAVYLVYLRAGR